MAAEPRWAHIVPPAPEPSPQESPPPPPGPDVPPPEVEDPPSPDQTDPVREPGGAPPAVAGRGC
jgi:hypothetical protein